jgi:hypothetical protein
MSVSIDCMSAVVRSVERRLAASFYSVTPRIRYSGGGSHMMSSTAYAAPRFISAASNVARVAMTTSIHHTSTPATT